MPDKLTDKIDDMCDFFKLLGDPTRLKILLLIEHDSLCVNEIAEKLGMTKFAVSHQLALLRKARLIKNEKRGKEVFYTIIDDHIETVVNTAFEHVSE